MPRKKRESIKYDVKCSICGNDIQVSEETYKMHMKLEPLNPQFKCRKCILKIGHERLVEKWYSMSDEERKETIDKLNLANKKWRENMSEEDRENLHNTLSSAYYNLSDEDKERLRKIASNTSKQYWANMSDEERKRKSIETSKRKIEMWKNMPAEKRSSLANENRIRSINFWSNISDEERQKIKDKCKERWERVPIEVRQRMSNNGAARVKEIWDSLSDEEKVARISRLKEKRVEWYDSLSEEEKVKYIADITKRVVNFNKNRDLLSEERKLEISNKQSVSHKNRWNNMDIDERNKWIHKRIASNKYKNNFHKKFEQDIKLSSIDSVIYLIDEYQVCDEYGSHHWDYGVFDENGELLAVVDLDGTYYHADNCDYDGIHSKIEYDKKRSKYFNGIKHFIIREKDYDTDFKWFIDHIHMNISEYNECLFKYIRALPFPYPHYTIIDLMRSYGKLERMDPNDKCHYIELNTRLGDHLIYEFHHSIWNDLQVKWKDDKQLREWIENGTVYHTHLNKNKLLINLTPHFPSAGEVRMIINKYASEYDTIFDPLGTPSVVLGTIASKKKFNSSISHETNNMLEFLSKYGVKIEEGVNTDCLITYTDKANIDELRKKYNCGRYIVITPDDEIITV